MKIKKNNQHLDNIFCDLGISRGQFFDCYFGSQKLDLYSEKYGISYQDLEKVPFTWKIPNKILDFAVTKEEEHAV